VAAQERPRTRAREIVDAGDVDHAAPANFVLREERPMRRLSVALCTALILPLAACQGADKSVTVKGEASYLEKIVLPPGSMLHVQVVDTRRADKAHVIAEDKFPATGVPIPFQLEVEAAKIEPNVPYGVRASVRNVNEKLEFASDTATPVDLKSPAPLEIQMNRAAGSHE
jgi:uncharacterized lipoprotein YbaY